MVSVKQLSIEINRNQVEEFFGQFSCRCDAWSSRGMSSSKNATVEIACESILTTSIGLSFSTAKPFLTTMLTSYIVC